MPPSRRRNGSNAVTLDIRQIEANRAALLARRECIRAGQFGHATAHNSVLIDEREQTIETIDRAITDLNLALELLRK